MTTTSRRTPAYGGTVQWYRCTEHLPEDGRDYLVQYANGRVYIASFLPEAVLGQAGWWCPVRHILFRVREDDVQYWADLPLGVPHDRD